MVLDSVEREAGWGPWQPLLEEAVEGCQVQLRKLEQALSDGGLSSVDRFSTDATHLYDLANELAERAEDIMRWRLARSEPEANPPDAH